MRHLHSSYLKHFYSIEALRNTVNRTVDGINNSGIDFTHIAVKGVSGLSIGVSVALALNKGIIVVRNPDVDSHSKYDVEGLPLNVPFNYIIVDDFVCSGKTIFTIHKAINIFNSNATLKMVYQYNDIIGEHIYSSFEETIDQWHGRD